MFSNAKASLAKRAFSMFAFRPSLPNTAAPCRANSFPYNPSRHARSSTRRLSKGLLVMSENALNDAPKVNAMPYELIFESRVVLIVSIYIILEVYIVRSPLTKCLDDFLPLQLDLLGIHNLLALPSS